MDTKEIKIIPSKSFAHRAYICDFLSGGDGRGVICGLDSDDIKATVRCLDALRSGGQVLDCGESGSTLRFMLPLAGVLGRDVTFATGGRLSERPMGALIDELRTHGMEIIDLPGGAIKASGRLAPGTYSLPGDISSQFITGLLLSLPYLDGSSSVMLTSPLQSKAYVDITLSVLADYGVSIEEHDGVYEIPGGQKYMCSGKYEVEGDWSQASFWLAAGLIGKEPVVVTGLKEDSVQGDRRIADIFRIMGGRIDHEDRTSSYTAYPSVLHGAEIDVSEVPDLAPAIAAAAAFTDGETKLMNAGRLRLKESDRIESIVRCLKDLGVRTEGYEDEITIYGCCSFRPSGGIAHTAGDHRIVMMAAVMSVGTEWPVEIERAESVNKSYPDFFKEFAEAGFDGNLVNEAAE